MRKKENDKKIKMNPKIAIIVLNYKNWKDTIECLESLQQVGYYNYQIVVVDNGSGNDSVKKIKEWADGKLQVESNFIQYNPELKPLFYLEYDKQIAESGGIERYENELDKHPSNKKLALVQTGENLGFSKGNNVGARYAKKRNFDYVILLNNDTIVMDSMLINRILDVFAKFPEAKVVGPKTIIQNGGFDGPYIYETFWGEVFSLSFKNLLHKFMGCLPVYIDINALSKPTPSQVYKISGACMAFDTNFLAKIGFLDEKIWLSCEEAIIAEKVLSYDKKIFFQPLTCIIHKKATAPREKATWREILRNHFKQREYFLRNYRQYKGMKLALIKLTHNIRLCATLLQSRNRKY